MIYFIQCGDDDGAIKIGYAGSVSLIHARLTHFQTGNHASLRLLGYVEGDMATEHEYHEMFVADRLRGEWFQPSPLLLIVARSPQHALYHLNVYRAKKRWLEWGLITANGRLTEQGDLYLLACEQRLAEDGYEDGSHVMKMIVGYVHSLDRTGVR